MALFTIYSSSAGSGKTFTLTKEYLKLILQSNNPRYFQQILAMTFTNDAAEEMKSRILSTLKELSSSDNEKSVMLEQIKKELPALTNDIVRERAKAAQHEILQNYNDFSVKTIDSFVNQIVSSFTFDLDLPYNYEIVLDTKILIAEAVRNLIDRVGSDENLTEMFKDFALDKLDDNKGWNTLEAEIGTFAEVIFVDNNAREIEKNMNLTHADVKQIKQKIKDFLKKCETDTQLLADQFFKITESKGLTDADFSYGSKGFYGYIKKVQKTPAVLFLEDISARTLTVLETQKWTSKSNAAVDSISGELHQILSQLIDLKTEKYKILDRVNKSLFKIPFLAIIKKEINEILLTRNEVVLSDFNQKILNVVSNEPVPYLFERIGEKFNHLLVDEFQDTSDIQFFNLLPLFENAIAKSHQNLIVGDPKQAIYSWRGGNVMLMLDLINQKPEYLNQKAPEIQQWQISTVLNATELKNLSTNYRSHQEVIDFNNALLTSIVSGLASPVAKQVFSDYIQLLPEKPKKGGYVQVEQLLTGEDSAEEKILDLIPEILQDGFRLSDIALLCRTSAEVMILAEALKSKGYEVNSADALKLKNNLSIKFLISALKYTVKPAREFERFEFLQFFFLVTQTDESLYNLKEVVSREQADFENFFKDLGYSIQGTDGLPPYQILEFYIQKFDLFSKEPSQDYLLALLDFALEYTNKQSKSLNDFLLDWEIQKTKLSVPPRTTNAITVQTIHKSKGLEYPVVILPFVKWKTEPKAGSEIWIGLENVDFDELKSETDQILSAPFRYSDEFWFTKDLLDHEKDLLLIENLNMLYVALTRAVQRQYIWFWTKEVKNAISVSGIGSYIKAFLTTTENYDPNQKKFEFGEKQEAILKNKETDSALTFALDYPEVFSGKSALILNPSVTDLEDYVKTGNLMHLVFEQIKKASDTPVVLQSLINRGLIKPEEQAAINSKINAVTSHPKLEKLFSSKAKVKNEVEILSNHSQVKRPDRVIFYDNEVFVVDYKTGQKAASHQKQLKGYSSLLKQMGYTKITLLLVYLEPLEVIVL